MKYLTKFYEVPLISLLNEESLKNLNNVFHTNYRAKGKRSTARIIQNIKLSELKKLMQTKPEGGGYVEK